MASGIPDGFMGLDCGVLAHTPRGRRALAGGVPWEAFVGELEALVTRDLHLIESGGSSLERRVNHDMIVCGYPTILCVALHEVLVRATQGVDASLDMSEGESSAANDQEVVRGSPYLVLALSGSPVEYAAQDLQPLLRRRLELMARRKDRALLSFSMFDQAYLRAAYGLQVARVHYAARYIDIAQDAAKLAKHRDISDVDGAGSALVQTFTSVPQTSTGGGHIERRQILVTRLKIALGPLGSDLVWGLLEELTADRFPYRLISYEAQYEYEMLSRFKAAVFVPWNWELVTFLEWYAVGLPVFVPSLQLMMPIILQSMAGSPFLSPNVTRWVNLRPEWAYASNSDASAVTPTDLGVETSSRWIAAWWAQTDYARAPLVRSFPHFADLLEQLAVCDFELWVSELRQSLGRSRRDAAQRYARLALVASGEDQ
eukprot:TRINITY_DN31106_c0_g1_i2.p1 TRINITY_DN31106_c0_g1~~TRINITY_DN31106_c0_g1_i2.p1  ORF type:complete len:453 (+),score=52.81 TRINITY_DN31106_c0_g1_i2:74-1360(+)